MTLRRMRRGGLVVSGVVVALCVLLLLNVTAPNPTGRRYSSEMPYLGDDFRLKGTDGERVLAADLGIPNNNASGQRTCFCDVGFETQTVVPGSCNECRVYIPIADREIEPHNTRRPDFITNTYIADSKNIRQFSSSDRSELTDYAQAAQILGIPLFVYTRVNTRPDSRTADIVTTTGGAVVPYFVVPGYVDPVDEAAGRGLAASGGLMSLLLMLEWRAGRRTRRRPTLPPPSPTPSRPIDDVESFTTRLKDRNRHRIDVEDSRNE